MKHLLGAVVAVFALVMASGPVVAGGWAEATLDSVPAPQAGEPVEVGFVIRQHGVTPVNPEGDVGIVVTSASGDRVFFVATQTGDIGHYVVEVTFPDPGTSTWAVRQGWFADHHLGSITVVEAAPDEVAAEGGFQWQGWLRVGLPLVVIVVGSFAFMEAVFSRRRRTAA